MNKMGITEKAARRSLLVLTLLLLSAACDDHQNRDGQMSTPAPANPARVSEIAPYMTKVAEAGFQGSIVVADDNGEIFFERAYGFADLENEIPFTPETAVNIGSTRKAYVSAIIMSLVDEGLLATDARITTYLQNVPPDKKTITLHQLMSHTAGLSDEFGTPLDTIERDELQDRILESELIFEPGSKYEYSDMGYALLQIIAEKVSGVPFRTLVDRRIFSPLDLDHTGFLDHPGWVFNGGDIPVALGYVNENEDKTELVHRPRTGWSPLGAGPMASTPRDAVKWMHSLAQGRVVSTDSVEQLFNPHIVMKPDVHWYGYGWRISKTDEKGTVIAHGGASNSHNFYIQYIKDDGVYIAAASNLIKLVRTDNNGDGDTTDPGDIHETFYAAEAAGGLARAIHQQDFTVLPRFMSGDSDE